MNYLIGNNDNLFNPFISLLSFTSKILMAYPPASTVFIFNLVLAARSGDEAQAMSNRAGPGARVDKLKTRTLPNRWPWL